MKVTEKEKIKLKGIVRYAYKAMGRAIKDYNMLADKDRILIGVSGGRDSLSLLHLFLIRQQRIPIDIELMVCIIFPSFLPVDRESLIGHLAKLGIKYTVKELNLKDEEIDCFWCSWNRRKMLFEVAREFDCNKIALGHNLDDIIETTLLNLFFNGEISTMKPRMELFGGKLVIIRPLCYLEKRDLSSLSLRLNLPFSEVECKYGKASSRQRIKQIITDLEKTHHFVKRNIFFAPSRIKNDYI